MLTVAIIIHIIVSLVIIVAVLLQSGKGAEMGSSFGGAGSQALFGSAGPATLLVKVTAVCVFIFAVTSVYITYTASHRKEKSVMDELKTVREAPADAQAPVQAPMQTPLETPAAAPATIPATPLDQAKGSLDKPSLDKPVASGKETGGVINVTPAPAEQKK